MQQILILGGGAAGLAAALAAAQTAEGRAHITVLDKNAKVGKKLLATGNGRCNLDNRDITPERYFTSSPKALRRLLSAVDEAAPLAWFESLGLYPRTDEAGRVYPYSNQAADVLALLEHHLSRLGVEVRTGCTVQNLSQSRGGYAVQIETEAGRETLRADAVICAMGGDAGPQFGTDGFGTRFAAQCGGRTEPLYPCLTEGQLCRFFPEKEVTAKTLLAHMLKEERIFCAENGRYYANQEARNNADKDLSRCVWVLLDFIDQVEYHTVGEFPAAILCFANGELYEIVPIPQGKETMICQLLRQPQKDAGKRIVVVDDAAQIELLDIPQVAGFCTVAEDGTVSYYKEEAALES